MSNYDADSSAVILRRKILGVKIRYARTRAGVNLQEVGEALGVSADVIADVEFGDRDVTLPQLEVMALLFDMPIVYFLSDTDFEDTHRNYPTQEAIALRQRVVGALLRQARVEGGRSQEQVAEYLGVSTEFVSNCELGQAEMPLMQLQALSGYLGVSLDYFLDEGLSTSQSNGQAGPGLEELSQFAELPKEIREFLLNPANLLYIKIAMSLSSLSAETLRALAEGLLEVTY